MAEHNWDPVVMVDANDTTCLNFPFLDYDTIYFKITLPIDISTILRGAVVKVDGAGTSCSPINIVMITQNYDMCINLDPVLNNNGHVICRYQCQLDTGDTYVFLLLVNKQLQICNIKI